MNGGGNAPPQDARCTRCEWGPYPDDRRHVLVLNHVYEFPFGAGRQYVNRGVLAQIVGNWNVSGIWSASSGDHFPATLAAAVSNSSGGEAIGRIGAATATCRQESGPSTAGSISPRSFRQRNITSAMQAVEFW